MPWSNQSGGGGWKGGGNGGSGGPWGAPPPGGGKGGGGGAPPDLEEILRRGQDRLKTVLPSGGGSPLLLPIIAVAVVGLWLFQCFYQVEPDEVGVELLFGKAKAELSEPGIHFRFWPIETVEKPKVRLENKEFIGSGEAGISRGGRDQSQMLSGDQNIIDIDFIVLWRIKDPIEYLFKVKDQPEVVRIVAESAMREVVGRTAAEPVRTGERQQVEEGVRDLIQKTLDEYQAGVLITGIKIERAEPPREVNDAFEEVQRAQQDQDKFKQNALAYSNKRLGEARGEASQIRESAKAYKARVIAEADGEAQRFVSVYDEYAKAKDVTKKRLFLETMEKVLKDSNKVIIESQSGSGVVPYLPLPEIQKRSQGVN